MPYTMKIGIPVCNTLNQEFGVYDRDYCNGYN